MYHRRTSWPRRQPNSSETRLATDIAATRLGWVQPILPLTVYPASARYWVIWVVFPDPVSPITISVWLSFTAYRTKRTHNCLTLVQVGLLFRHSHENMCISRAFIKWNNGHHNLKIQKAQNHPTLKMDNNYLPAGLIKIAI